MSFGSSLIRSWPKRAVTCMLTAETKHVITPNLGFKDVTGRLHVFLPEGIDPLDDCHEHATSDLWVFVIQEGYLKASRAFCCWFSSLFPVFSPGRFSYRLYHQKWDLDLTEMLLRPENRPHHDSEILIPDRFAFQSTPTSTIDHKLASWQYFDNLLEQLFSDTIMMDTRGFLRFHFLLTTRIIKMKRSFLNKNYIKLPIPASAGRTKTSQRTLS
jgi:hypothetical protein